MLKVATIFFLTFFSIYFILPSSGSAQVNKNRVRKAVIEFESFTTTTAESVKCEAFRKTFKESLKKVEFIKSELDELSKYQNKFLLVKPRSIDVRVLLKLYFDDKIEQYCMDRFGIFVHCKSGKYFENKSLSELIRRKCLPPNLQN
ncbi:hypothetical protein ACTJJB_04345 [Chitinophaga sp. 22536]|uniref:hypothetical protein n=1 Tax=unclassified Chitinophaga TaxID=2619133 RepID=UPI003F82D9DD